MIDTADDKAGRLAVVTGASSGIGRAVAVALAQRGWATVLLARNAQRLQSLAAELEPLAPSHPCPADLSQTGQVGPLMQRIGREHGPIAVLVNNAGFGDNRRFLDLPIERQRQMFELNYHAAAEATYAVLPAMLKAGYGRIINIASMATKAFPAGMAAYAATKSAMATLTYGLASEYRGRGVRFCCVHPGLIRTAFFDDPVFDAMAPMIRRHGIAPERVARAVVKLIHRPKLHVCVPWWHKLVDWLWALSPSLISFIGSRAGHPAPSPSSGPEGGQETASQDCNSQR